VISAHSLLDIVAEGEIVARGKLIDDKRHMEESL